MRGPEREPSVEDLLEEMSLADGKAYNEHLMPICRGEVLPNRAIPVEYILYDVWEEMRTHDRELADGILEPTFTCMRAQTDNTRLRVNEFGQYLEYREKDVGKALLSAVMRFVMGIHLSADELERLSPLEQNYAKHLIVVNDIFSWEKELKASQLGHEEGSTLCSAVIVVATGTNLSFDAAKRILWLIVREWELVHDDFCAEMVATGCSEAMKAYMKGLEYQLSGNEMWSRTTLRYAKLD
ncbi:Aristolochene synthase from penicillium Roqueforti [Penicillium paradoxum]|uniref:Aristolochene synthase from penicillium Roqueforti n=1 Tax=Penicillium paradoxum TaxID=176176 RepID=UPI0025472BD4|nr:Aristolochene synthase from penicillium Roqueforti [Penicillium paradoxum]KAJ5787198.1 Aristolochene synthase from penicillium Roqueforti [Penicillium paradoxum]